MIVHITRFILVIAGALGGYATSGLIDWAETTGYPHTLVILILIILGTSIGYLAGSIIGREVVLGIKRAEERFRSLSPGEIVLGTAGLVIGLVIAWLVSQPLRLIQPTSVAAVTTTLMFAMAGYGGLSLALMKREDVVAAFPSLSGAQRPECTRPLRLLDTSAVIDGRFLELWELGGLDGDLRLPRFVLAELQTLADSADDVKRARGRRGLDLLLRVRAEDTIKPFETDYPEIPTVDEKLLSLASDTGGTLITVDFNLTKVARVRGLGVVNINELAAALKPAYLPGEALVVSIAREGKEPDQGVGYLEDGTMVVVQGGASHVGSTALTEVTSVLQTSAGRMIFARFTAPSTADEVAPGSDVDAG